MVPDGTIFPVGARSDTPESDWADQICLVGFGQYWHSQRLRIPRPDGSARVFLIQVTGSQVRVESEDGRVSFHF